MAERTITVWTPILYVTVLLVALVVFSNAQRKRKLQQLAETPQFYEHSFARDIYHELQHKEKVPPKLLKAALLAWGSEEVTRLLRYRDSEPVMANLLQAGLIGENVAERFSGSKTLSERELQSIAVEASKLHPQWTTVLPNITEIAQQNAVRRRIAQQDVFRKEYYELAGLTPPIEESDAKE